MNSQLLEEIETGLHKIKDELLSGMNIIQASKRDLDLLKDRINLLKKFVTEFNSSATEFVNNTVSKYDVVDRKPIDEKLHLIIKDIIGDVKAEIL
jgi:archaellum component FlaC